MGKWLKRLGLLVLVLAVLAGGAALWKREEIARLMAVNTLFAPDRIVGNFSHMDRAFLTAPVPRGAGAARRLKSIGLAVLAFAALRAGATLLSVARASESDAALETRLAFRPLSFLVCMWRVAWPRCWITSHAAARSSSEL